MFTQRYRNFSSIWKNGGFAWRQNVNIFILEFDQATITLNWTPAKDFSDCDEYITLDLLYKYLHPVQTKWSWWFENHSTFLQNNRSLIRICKNFFQKKRCGYEIHFCEMLLNKIKQTTWQKPCNKIVSSVDFLTQ